MPSRISCSVHHSMCPRVSRATFKAKYPSAGAPIASERAIVSGFTGVTSSAPSRNACATGRQPCGLGAADPVGLLLDRADRDQLTERPVDLREQSAPHAIGHHHVVGQTPAELLGGLEPERLGALGVVGAHVHVHERPWQCLGDLAAETVHLVVVALDRDDLGAVGLGREDLRSLEVLGHEDVALDAGLRRVGGGGVRQVAGRGARDRLDSRTRAPSSRRRSRPGP